ncbi:MAG TPA: hypothetical protein VI216_06375 [Candidatus Acidoferrales bacterium]
MTDATPRLVSEVSISRVAATMAAIMLIFLGIVFQWGQLGEGQFNVDGFWVIHMVALNVWNLVAIHMGLAGLVETLRFWPLLLVAFGLAILLALKPGAGKGRVLHNGGNPRA